MIDDMVISKVKKKVEIIQGELIPLSPSDELITIGNELINVANELINTDADTRTFVSIGYHVIDIAPHTCTIRANGNHQVLFFNLLFSELLSDLIMFQTYRSKEACIYILSKYSRFMVMDDDHSTALFYNWLYHQYTNVLDSDYRDHFPKAIIGSIFILFHEWLHNNSDLRNSTKKLMNSSKDLRQACPELNDSLFDELSCDFTALVLCNQSNFETIFKCNKTEMLSVSMLALYVKGIYDFLFNIRLNASSPSNRDPADYILEALNTRFKAIASAIKISINGNYFFDECDLNTVMNSANETISCFLKESGRFYEENLYSLADKYNSTAVEEWNSFLRSLPSSPWMLFA